MDSVQEQENKKQKLEQEPCEEQQDSQQEEEQEEAQYSEEDLILGHALLEAVIVNDLVK